MKHILLCGSALVVALAAATGAMAAGHNAASFTGHALASQAHVTMAEARAIALKARPGKFAAQELEKESGGSGLRYSFDIKAAGHLYEVGIDAATGRVLENSAEGAHPD